MGSDEPNKHATVRLLADALRLRTAGIRQSTRALAIAAEDNGMNKPDIIRLLDVDEATLTRLLAADGTRRCIECAYDSHNRCLGVFGDGHQSVPCECECGESGTPS